MFKLILDEEVLSFDFMVLVLFMVEFFTAMFKLILDEEVLSFEFMVLVFFMV
jgi:hypothetical protein